MKTPSEDLYAFHIDSQIEKYFSNLDYEVSVVDKPTRRKEKDLGFDSLFKDSKQLKCFALQHKRPQERKKWFSFKLENDQHDILQQNTEWMFHCFPVFSDYNLLKNALHHIVITPATFQFQSTFPISKLITGYPFKIYMPFKDIHYPWGFFANSFLNCNIGMIEEDMKKVEGQIYDVLADNTSMYVFDLEQKKLFIARYHQAD